MQTDIPIFFFNTIFFAISIPFKICALENLSVGLAGGKAACPTFLGPKCLLLASHGEHK